MKKRLNFQAYRNYSFSKRSFMRLVVYLVVLGLVIVWLKVKLDDEPTTHELPQEIDLEGVEF